MSKRKKIIYGSIVGVLLIIAFFVMFVERTPQHGQPDLFESTLTQEEKKKLTPLERLQQRLSRTNIGFRIRTLREVRGELQAAITPSRRVVPISNSNSNEESAENSTSDDSSGGGTLHFNDDDFSVGNGDDTDIFEGTAPNEETQQEEDDERTLFTREDEDNDDEEKDVTDCLLEHQVYEEGNCVRVGS